jgi:RNA polymerase sigma-70 factor (ECF subfamily)
MEIERTANGDDETSDEYLVLRAQNGDARALDRLLRRSQRSVERQLSRHSLDEADRADVTQEVLLQVARNLESFRHDARFGTWLFRITFTTAAMFLRRRRDRPTDPAAAVFDQVSPMPGAERLLLDEENRAEVWRVYRSLPPQERALLAAYYFDEASLADIASSRSATEPSVRSAVHRARVALRRQWRMQTELDRAAPHDPAPP